MPERALQGLHDRAFHSVMQCSIRFFDTQPIGRILNRFTKDIGCLDELLPETCLDFFQLAVLTVASVVVVCAIEPWMVLAMVPAAVVFAFLRAYYIQAARDLKRIEATSRSPVYQHVNQTFDGLAVLHALPGAVERYQAAFEEHQDGHARAWVAFIIVSRWLGSRLDSIVVFITIITVFAAVGNREGKTAGEAGLALVYVIGRGREYFRGGVVLIPLPWPHLGTSAEPSRT